MLRSKAECLSWTPEKRPFSPATVALLNKYKNTCSYWGKGGVHLGDLTNYKTYTSFWFCSNNALISSKICRMPSSWKIYTDHNDIKFIFKSIVDSALVYIHTLIRVVIDQICRYFAHIFESELDNKICKFINRWMNGREQR